MAKTIKIGVEGMHCVNCQAAVERSLKARAGVLSASVVLSSKSALVSFDPAQASPADLADAVRSAGYEPRLAEDEKKN